jgi:hypothetical protein
MENIYYLIFLTVLISGITPFMKRNILREYSILEQIIYTNIIILIVIIPIYSYYEKKTLSYFVSQTKNKEFTNLLLYSLIIVVALVTSGYILQNVNSIIKFKGIQRSLSIILLTVVGCCIYKETFTLKMFSGIVCILLGIYLLD